MGGINGARRGWRMRGKGRTSTQVVIKKGVGILCHYKTAYGAMSLGVAADEIESHLTEVGGEVRFSYTLDTELNGLVSRNLVNITVQPVPPQ